ncbi:MAG TPA: hypothetical protein DDW87_12125 [Firmicutes bacterium]|nr:hypothetical protein [Bacillota bacterium]
MGKFVRRILIPVLLIFSISTAYAKPAPQVALVLGGGAARGFSHIGLIQAFEDHGIPIDLLVGTSMGSIIASLYASGYSVDNMRTVVAELGGDNLVDITFPPKGGLLGTGRIKVFLDALLDQAEFSDLVVPFHSVITNVTTGEEWALNEGAVSTGVLASMSIPGLFPAVQIGDHHYVDGGMKNAVPVNVAKDLGADVVVGVDVKKELEEINYDSILNTLQLTMWFMIDGYVQLNTEQADVIIVPNVMFDSYMDYQKSDHFVEEGYQSGVRYLHEIKAAILAHDPAFEFVPYKQEGLSPQELEDRLRRAGKAASELRTPLRIRPELRFPEQSPIPTMGLGVTGGALRSWQVGYRYDFDLEDGGHEGYLGWSKPEGFAVEVLARKSRDYEGLTYGVRASSPLIGRSYLSAECFTQGTQAWRLAAHTPYLLQLPKWTVGSVLEIGRRRLTQDALYIGVDPQVRWFPSADYASVLEVALARGYLYAGLDFESEIHAWDPLLRYSVGVGSEVRLFGLYPLDVQVGLEFGHGGPVKWQLGIVGGRF